MLDQILIALAVVLILFGALVASRASAYHVERKLAITAPVGLVFGVLNDLQQFARVLVLFGSPWDKLDPNLHKTCTGSATGVGQSLSWSGSKVGQGQLRIEESIVNVKETSPPTPATCRQSNHCGPVTGFAAFVGGAGGAAGRRGCTARRERMPSDASCA